MTIKKVFKGKKNLFVFEMLGEADNVFFKVHETNVKLKQFDVKKYLLESKENYLKSKSLKTVSYFEFEEALSQEFKKVSDKVQQMFKKFDSIANERKNPEFRHFMYEYRLGATPLLTEGVVKNVQIAKELNDTVNEWNNFVTSLNEILGDEATAEFLIELPINYTVFKDVLPNNYCSAVVRKEKYVFDEEVFDTEPDEEELEEESVPTQEGK